MTLWKWSASVTKAINLGIIFSNKGIFSSQLTSLLTLNKIYKGIEWLASRDKTSNLSKVNLCYAIIHKDPIYINFIM